MRSLGLRPGQVVVLSLHAPKEKIWGVLLSVNAAGIVVRGVDLVVFEDWMRQEAHRSERVVGPTTVFYPMHRVERMERDETVGPVAGFADRFALEVGRSAVQGLGVRGYGRSSRSESRRDSVAQGPTGAKMVGAKR
jgi:hypothetical protein